MLPRIVCSRPFKRFDVRREGDVGLCCRAWLGLSAGNLASQPLDEIWNGPVARAVRRSVLDGSFRFCSRELCPFLGTVSGPVRRLADVTDDELLAAIRGRRVRLPYPPRSVNCTYDSSCNLSCPSCRTELRVVSAIPTIRRLHARVAASLLPECHELVLTGSGDPFAGPGFRSWLRGLTRADAPRLREIELMTNGLLWTRGMWASLSPFARRHVRVAMISVDAATPETYASNRRGGDYSKLLRNLEFVAELRRNGSLRWLGLFFVVQANNFREMAAFVRLGWRLGVDQVCFTGLVNWGTYQHDEYLRRAVHDPDHPLHQDLLARIQDLDFDPPFVHLGTLARLRAEGRPRRRARSRFPPNRARIGAGAGPSSARSG